MEQHDSAAAAFDPPQRPPCESGSVALQCKSEPSPHPVAALLFSHPAIPATANDPAGRPETHPFDSCRAVRLLDNRGRLRANYPTIQAAISAAMEGDEVVVAPGIYREDLHIERPITLTRADVDGVSERACVKAHIVGRVVVTTSAMKVRFHGIAIDGGPLELDSAVAAHCTPGRVRVTS